MELTSNKMMNSYRPGRVAQAPEYHIIVPGFILELRRAVRSSIRGRLVATLLRQLLHTQTLPMPGTVIRTAHCGFDMG
jgi:hypothetical protein